MVCLPGFWGQPVSVDNFVQTVRLMNDGPSLALTRRNIVNLIDIQNYSGLIIPYMMYSFRLTPQRDHTGLFRALLFWMAVGNLLLFTAAAPWLPRYAFPALIMAAFFIALLFALVLTSLSGRFLSSALGNQSMLFRLRLAMAVWRDIVILPPAAGLTREIVRPQPDCAAGMARKVDALALEGAVVEAGNRKSAFSLRGQPIIRLNPFDKTATRAYG